jgi:hypothetical protein
MPNKEDIEEELKRINGTLESLKVMRNKYGFNNPTVGVLGVIHSSLEKHIGKLPDDIDEMDKEIICAFERLYKMYDAPIEKLIELRGQLLSASYQ